MAKKKKQQSGPVPIVPLLDVTKQTDKETPSTSKRAERSRSGRKWVNVKLLLILLSVTLTLGVAVNFLHAYQVERSAGVLLERAEKLLADEKPEEAARYLRQYAGFRPDDVAALALLADTLQKTAKTPRDELRAYLTYEQVLRLDGSRRSLRRAQVKRAIRFRRTGDARVHLEVLLKEASRDGELRFFAGVVEEADRRFDKAARYYHVAIADGYNPVEVYVRLAGVLRDHLSDPDAADRIVDAMVAQHRDSGKAYLARAVYHRKYGTLKLALADVIAAEKLDPKLLAAVLFHAEWILSESNRSPAELETIRDKLNKRLAKHPREPHLYRLVSQAEVRLKRPQQAIAVLLRGREALPNELTLIWPLADLLISADKTDEAAVEIKRLRELKAPEWIVDYLEGRILYDGGKMLAARLRLESAAAAADRASGIWNASHLLLGQCYHRMGAYQRELDAFGLVVDADPLSVEGRLGMADAYGALGRTNEALKIYRTLPQAPGVALKTARLLFARNLQLPAENRNWSAVESYLKTLTGKTNRSIDAELMRAQLFVVRGDTKQAVTLLDQLQKRHPNNVDVRCALVRLAIHAGDRIRAGNILKQIRKELGDSVAWRITSADFYRDQPGSESNKALKKLEQGLDRFSPVEQLQIREHLARVWMFVKSGETKQAERLWREIAAAHPYLIGPRFRRFLAAYAQGDRSAMRDSLAALKTIEGPAGLHVAAAEAATLIQTAKYENRRKAETVLNRLRERRPNWPLVYVLQAAIYEAEESPESAVVEYQQAIQLGLRSPRVLRRTLQLMYRLGEYRQMDQLATDLSRDTSASILSPFRRATAAVSLKTGDFKHALTLARSAVRPDSTDPADHVWLGQVYSLTGHHAEAKREFDRAIELAPAQPGPRVALVQLLVKTGRRKEAGQAVRAAVQKLSGDETALALGLIYELIGKVATAEQYYLKALSDHRSRASTVRDVAAFYLRNRHANQAEPLLHRLIDHRPPFPENFVRWARRSLAVAIGSRDYAGFLRAVELLDRNLTGSQDPTPDRLIKARLLASHPGTKYRRQAVAIFEKLASAGRLTEADQQRLVVLYDALRQPQEADTAWTTLLTNHKSDAAVLVAYIRRQLRHNQVADALLWWKRLNKTAPKLPETVELHARLLVKEHHPAEAVTLLSDYIRGRTPAVAKKAPDETPRIGRLAQSALLMANLTTTAELSSAERERLRRQTEIWFRESVPHQPRLAPVFAVFLARFQRTDEALDVLKSAAAKLAPLQVTLAGIAVVRIAHGSAAQFQRVEQWLDRLVKQHPGSADVLFQKADLRIAQQRYDDAIVLYRTVLLAKPHDAVALNNLAWYLSMLKGQHAAARKLIDRAIELVGPVAAYLETRGSIRLNQGDADGAVQDFKEALLQTDTPLNYFRLAQAQAAAGHLESAAISFRKANQTGLDIDQLEAFERDAFLALSRQLKTTPSP